MSTQTQRREYTRYRARAVRRRRRVVVLALIGIPLVAVAGLLAGSGGRRGYGLPSRASLAGLGVGQRIVAIADSQVGYRTDPSHSYCNKFSAFWDTGSSGGCLEGTRSEEWCADFAAWAWRQAGVSFTYGYGPGEIDAGAASFYIWGLDTGRWHPVGSGFRPAAGDVAVYGLSLAGGTPSAVHVAIVVRSGVSGPDVINGDGDRTGFSVVETGTDQTRADTGRGGGAPLAGYVSPV